MENLELRQFEKLSKSQGNLSLLWKNLEISGENVTYETQLSYSLNGNVFQQTFLFCVSQGKVGKYPGNIRERSGNLVS